MFFQLGIKKTPVDAETPRRLGSIATGGARSSDSLIKKSGQSRWDQ
jgi:hypothetical protein